MQNSPYPDARILHLLNKQGKGITLHQKPNKIYFGNPAFAYAFQWQPNTGTVRGFNRTLEELSRQFKFLFRFKTIPVGIIEPWRNPKLSSDTLPQLPTSFFGLRVKSDDASFREDDPLKSHAFAWLYLSSE